MVRRLILLAMVGLLGSWLAQAAVASPTFERRIWGRAEGAPQSAYGIAQDADGMLWFATGNGLFSFDGAHFARVDAVYGHALRSNNVVSVVATRDGIAVGYQFGGISTFSPSAARHYGETDGLPAGSVAAMAVDASGVLHAGFSTGLARLDAGRDRWQRLPSPSGARSYVRWIGFDDGGTMWIASDPALYAMFKGGARYHKVATLTYSAMPAIVGGKLVTYTAKRHLTRFSPLAEPAAVRNNLHFGPDHLLFDGPHGTTWAWTNGGTMLLRTDGDGALQPAQKFEAGDLPGRMVARTLVDREDNLWVSTLDGVERYRMHRLNALALPSTVIDLHVRRGLGDEMLVASGNEGPVWRYRNGRMDTLPGVAGITAMYRQDNRSVWLGGPAGLFHLTPDGTARWALPPLVPKGYAVQAIAADSAGNLLVAIVRLGLFRSANGQWTKMAATIPGGDETPVCMVPGASGRLYLGYTAGRVAEMTPGGIRMIATGLGTQVGNVLSILEYRGKLLVGGDSGMAWIGQGGGARPFVPERMPAFRGISGMGIDLRGDLWLHGPDGLFRVAAAELDASQGGAAHAVRWEVFDFEDGVRGQVAQIRPLPSLAVAPDGKVFYATTSQVGWIDPASLRRNRRPPHVLIQSIRAGNVTAPVVQAMKIPAGTSSMEITFTATALSIPERVRFRYRLSGVDDAWQEPGHERAARYTNLKPGQYRFQVVAANEDGVWNEAGAVLDVEIEPTIWQTHWFRLLLAACAAIAIVALYRWRIAVAARRAAEHTATRIEERERIARNLHDNLLQGVQGLVLSCHAILMRMAQGTPEERSLSEALGRADLMIEETRDEVMNLRRDPAGDQLTGRLQQAIDRFGGSVRHGIGLAVTGRIERIRLEVASEISYVLQEAIANSARHSGAASIRVSVDAASSGLHCFVMDDGCGMSPELAARGKAGHWGLLGMRERLARLGGTLKIDSTPGSGTTVSFDIPAKRAYLR